MMGWKNCLRLVGFFALFGLLPSQVVASENWSSQPVKVCVDPDWEPLEKLTPEGDFVGIAADLLALIFQRAQLTYEIVPSSNWDQSLQLAQNGECHLLALLNKTDARAEWLNFTRPYLIDPMVIITRVEHPYIASLQELKRATLALPKSTSVYEWIRRDYPDLTIIPVETEFEAFDLVERGLADATVRALTISAFTIRNQGWFNLKMAGELQEYKNLLRMGVLKAYPALVEQLDQAIATLNESDVNTAINNHIKINAAYRVDWSLIKKIVFVATVIVILLALLSVLQLRSRHRLLTLKRQLEQQVREKEIVSQRLEASEKLYKSLLDTAHEGIAVIQDGRFVYVNESLAQMTGYSLSQLRSMSSFMALVPKKEQPMILALHQQRLLGESIANRYETKMVNASGQEVTIEVSGALIQWFDRPATLNFVTDITQRKLAEREIIYLANHDALTGLANRRLLMERLDRLIDQAERYQEMIGVLFLDLNGFKAVNDTYGHETGDLLLNAVTSRLAGVIRKSDTFARVGGDEFVILVPRADEQSIAALSRKLKESISPVFHLQRCEVSIGVSMGTAFYPEDGQTTSQLLKIADERMYQEKKNN